MSSKSEGRKFALSLRNELSKDELENLSLLLVENLLKKVPIIGNELVSIFLPIEKFNEPNTLLLATKLNQLYPEIRFCVPVVVKHEMQQVEWNLNEPLEVNSWGIPEPIPPFKVVDIHEIDLVVTPTLGFNKRNFRIGYGKGFYDRFFANSAFQGLKIGYCLSNSASDFIEDMHDISLDLIITPN